MKNNSIIICILLVILFVSCKKSDDYVVAEVYNNKLYFSEIRGLLPDGLNEEDSAQMASNIIDDWISRHVILHEAEKVLSAKEKNFDNDLAKFRESLLINAYYQHITSDSTRFSVTENELQSFINRYEPNDAIEREIVKLNYVKLSKNSRLLKPIKEIMFDNLKRNTQKAKIEQLCGDSIEYFIDDDTWFYLDDLKQELPIDVLNKDSFLSENNYLEKSDNKFTYIIVFLDYKTRRATIQTEEEIQAAREMLIHQKKADYIEKKVSLLCKKSLENKKIIR